MGKTDKIIFTCGELDYNNIAYLGDMLTINGITDFRFVTSTLETTVDIKSMLVSEAPVRSFVILTRQRDKFAKDFPNNIVDISGVSDGDEVFKTPICVLKKLCNQIVYIMTNFGREYRDFDNVWVCADSHFHHTNIIKYCNRPWNTVEEMNEGLIERWNEVVGENDTVIHLGDFSFGNRTKVESVFHRLNGKIDLVLGNHDRLKIGEYYDIGFHRVYDRPVIYDGFFVMSHAPLQWIKDDMPYANIFGHVHDMPLYKTWTKNTCCACVDRHDYRPIRLSEIKKKFEELNDDKTKVL